VNTLHGGDFRDRRIARKDGERAPLALRFLKAGWCASGTALRRLYARKGEEKRRLRLAVGKKKGKRFSKGRLKEDLAAMVRNNNTQGGKGRTFADFLLECSKSQGFA